MKTNGDFIVTGGKVGIGTTIPNSLCPVSRWWWFLLIIPINWIEVANFYRKIM
ncbi:hypothetical protein [Pedobacter gandavensis]|uniref:hypothetical protein n=1 Tax=Pedobacter gandavensis TaxID=2679963 RepID=UPI00292D9869|nr:hypothetical protein [Pedobacter gandavensis]